MHIGTGPSRDEITDVGAICPEVYIAGLVHADPIAGEAIDGAEVALDLQQWWRHMEAFHDGAARTPTWCCAPLGSAAPCQRALPHLQLLVLRVPADEPPAHCCASGDGICIVCTSSLVVVAACTVSRAEHDVAVRGPACAMNR